MEITEIDMKRREGSEIRKSVAPESDGSESSDRQIATYKDRFENLLRVAKKVTATLHIGDILEIIRDEVRMCVPQAREACLVLVDPDAPKYTRPLHCAVEKGQINCRMCKQGKKIVKRALSEPVTFYCSPGSEAWEEGVLDDREDKVCEIALPIFDGNDSLAVLNVVTAQDYSFSDRDIVLLKDLAELATNAIINAKSHAKVASEKLTLERILGHIRPFVPETVQRIIEKNPDAPAFNRQELDVSVLFLDVADYTRISEYLTQDKVNFIIEKYFSSFLDSIYLFDGDVNETAGDGLMALFRGDENQHALNAVNAALEIRKRAHEINEELKGVFYPVVVNMGINSGKASVGMARFDSRAGTRMTFTASGTVTNLAARVASAAKEGDILIGPETAQRVSGNILMFDRGPMTFKNVKDSVHVYSLVPSM